MPYALTVGHLHVLPTQSEHTPAQCSCEHARHACTPAYVFSIIGQVEFRSALLHLARCRTHDCRALRRRVLVGMTEKLHWLLNENVLVGCVQIQPHLYGRERVTFHRDRFAHVASHLARCPKESCAQLRRALLLSVRDRVRPTPELHSPPPSNQSGS